MQIGVLDFSNRFWYKPCVFVRRI